MGTGTSATTSATTAAGVSFRRRLSGRRIRRWVNTGPAICFTSSGRTKFRPETAASACEVRNKANDARGLPPRLTSSQLRVFWTIWVM